MTYRIKYYSLQKKNRIKYSKSLVESGRTVHLLLRKSQYGSIPSPERLVASDVGGTVFSSAALGGSRRFFNTGGITTESSSSLVKRDMFWAGDITNLFRGRQTGGCVGSFFPHQCNKSHMLPYFARALASSSASQSSGQTPRQEPTQKGECQIIRSSKLQRERYDVISSTKVSLSQFPGLMVHGMTRNSKTRRLLRMNPDTGYFEEQDVAAGANHHGHYDLQVPHRHVCRGSAYGWIFLTDNNLDMKLLNPFSGAEIQLPSVKTLPPSDKDEEERWSLSKWFVYKAVFSANPSIEPRPVVLIIYGGELRPRLAFCKPGDKGWTPLEFPKNSFHKDIIYHEGQFFVLGWPGYVAAFDIGRRIDDDDHSVKTVVVATAPKRRVYFRDWFLVVLDGELVRFELRSMCFRDCCINESMEFLEKERKRDGDTTDEDCCFVDHSDEESIYGDTGEESGEESGDEIPLRYVCVRRRLPPRTYGIKIRRFDVSEKQWVKVESLGDKAVFLGYNTSFALSASDYPGLCIPDSVYFTCGCGGNEYTHKPFYDMGIYNVKDKTVKPIYPPMDDEGNCSFYFKKPAPIWIVNSADR